MMNETILEGPRNEEQDSSVCSAAALRDMGCGSDEHIAKQHKSEYFEHIIQHRTDRFNFQHRAVGFDPAVLKSVVFDQSVIFDARANGISSFITDNFAQHDPGHNWYFFTNRS